MRVPEIVRDTFQAALGGIFFGLCAVGAGLIVLAICWALNGFKL